VPTAPVASIHFFAERKTVAPGFVSNSLEFEGIEIGVVELLPHPEEQNGILVSQPLFDQSAAAIKVLHHIGKRYESCS
jgi:hypothetical protein